MGMKKAVLLLIILGFILPQTSFAYERLFYFFDNESGYDSLKDNYKSIDTFAPQIYTVTDNLKVKGPTEKRAIKQAKRRNVDVVPLLVNDHFDKVLMSSILISEKAQNDIIEFMIDEAKDEGYRGWQFDFENINHLDRDMYTAFVKKTGEAMKENNLEFSVAVIVRDRPYDKNSTDQDWSSAYDFEELAKHVDFLSLMSYDDPRSVGPVASIPYVKRILNYLLPIIPNEKISLGIPLYCWQWQDNVKVASVSYDRAKKAYKEVDDRKKKNSYSKSLGAEYFRFTRDGVHNEIWCDGAKGLTEKKKLIEKYDLRGYSAWALGQETDKWWRVLKRI